MRQRSGIQLGSPHAPLWQKLAHQGVEALVVRSFKQMHKLVHDDVFQALHRLFYQFQVQPDTARLRIPGLVPTILVKRRVYAIKKSPESRRPAHPRATLVTALRRLEVPLHKG